MASEKWYYRARAQEWSLGESSKGTPYVAVRFAVLSEGAQWQQLTWYGYCSDATADRTIESLRLMGWQGDDITQLSGLDANDVDLVVELEEYEGKQSPRVRWVNKPGGLAIAQPLEGDKLKAFGAAMRDKVRALDASAGKRRPTPPAPRQDARPEPPPISDADLPF